MIALWDRQYYSHYIGGETEGYTIKLLAEVHTDNKLCSKLSTLGLPGPNQYYTGSQCKGTLYGSGLFFPLSIEIGSSCMGVGYDFIKGNSTLTQKSLKIWGPESDT